MAQNPSEDWLNKTVSGLNFTRRASDSFYDTVDDPEFQNRDMDMIFETLKGKMTPVRFGDYLKRYIYRKAGFTGPLSEVPLQDYLDVICYEFAERRAPHSFTPTKATLRNLAKNWLNQQTVSRNVVLLLGFGLGMSAEDVDDFLRKGLRESQINSKDPLEVICWYCYRNGYGFAKYTALWSLYSEQPRTGSAEGRYNNTVVLHRKMLEIQNDDQLMTYLKELPMFEDSMRQSVAAREQFDRLYAQMREVMARLLTTADMDSAGVKAERLMDELDRNSRLYDYEKLDRINRERANHGSYRPEDIGPGDVEQMLFAAIPRDVHGNMLPMKASALQEQFQGKRLTRQHISQILSGKEPITRYDLLTMHFYVFSQDLDRFKSVNQRYISFMDSANRILEDSGMGEYYVVNLYECFLLMCIISKDPLGTFSDVWEMSYE